MVKHLICLMFKKLEECLQTAYSYLYTTVCRMLSCQPGANLLLCNVQCAGTVRVAHNIAESCQCGRLLIATHRQALFVIP